MAKKKTEGQKSAEQVAKHIMSCGRQMTEPVTFGDIVQLVRDGVISGGTAE